jgi:hypothetical protein
VPQQWFFFENALGQKTGGDKRPQTAVGRPVSVFLKKWKAS